MEDAGSGDYNSKGIGGTYARVSVSESIKNFPRGDCYVVRVFQHSPQEILGQDVHKFLMSGH